MKAEFIEKIEDFLDGQITKEELQKLANASEVENLDEEIAWVENARTAIEVAGLRSQLEEVLPKQQREEAKVRRIGFLKPFLAIAATILIFILTYLSFFDNQQGDLYAQHAYIDPGLPVLMSQSDDHLLFDALTYFGEGNYEVAADKLTKIKDQYPNSDTLAYYLGASLLYLDKPEAAKPYFGDIAKKSASEFQERAQWQLVLTIVKQGDYQSANELLKPILSNSEHLFYKEATNLQQDLNGL